MEMGNVEVLLRGLKGIVGCVLGYQCIIGTNRSSSDKGFGLDEVRILEEDLEMGKEEKRR